MTTTNRSRDRAVTDAYAVFKGADVIYVPDTGPRSPGYWASPSGGEARNMAEIAMRVAAHELRMAAAKIEGDLPSTPRDAEFGDPADAARDKALELSISRLHRRAWELEGGGS